MPAGRFFHPHPLKEGECYPLSVEERKHLSVLRLSKEAPLELVNGRGQLAKAVVSSEGVVRVVECHTLFSRTPGLTLVQGLSQMHHLEWLAEKGCELGMEALFLFPAERSPIKTLSPTRWQRLEKLLIAALKQSGNLFLPELKELPPLLSWKSPLNGPMAFGQESAPLLNAPPTFFINGPEGGLTTKEKAHLEQLGAIAVSLHKHTLRTETAGLAALTISGFLRSCEAIR